MPYDLPAIPGLAQFKPRPLDLSPDASSNAFGPTQAMQGAAASAAASPALPAPPAPPPPGPAPKPPYDPKVEQWRQIATEEGVKPQDIDKFLHVLTYESGGNPGALNGPNGEAGAGLLQDLPGTGAPGDRPTLADLQDPRKNIREAVRLLYDGGPNAPANWKHWGGDGALYQGKPFGALSLHPYPGDPNYSATATNGPALPLAPALARNSSSLVSSASSSTYNPSAGASNAPALPEFVTRSSGPLQNPQGTATNRALNDSETQAAKDQIAGRWAAYLHAQTEQNGTKTPDDTILALAKKQADSFIEPPKPEGTWETVLLNALPWLATAVFTGGTAVPAELTAARAALVSATASTAEKEAAQAVIAKAAGAVVRRAALQVGGAAGSAALDSTLPETDNPVLGTLRDAAVIAPNFAGGGGVKKVAAEIGAAAVGGKASEAVGLGKTPGQFAGPFLLHAPTLIRKMGAGNVASAVEGEPPPEEQAAAPLPGQRDFFGNVVPEAGATPEKPAAPGLFDGQQIDTGGAIEKPAPVMGSDRPEYRADQSGIAPPLFGRDETGQTGQMGLAEAGAPKPTTEQSSEVAPVPTPENPTGPAMHDPIPLAPDAAGNARDRRVVHIDDLEFRPADYQGRDVTEGKPYLESRVRQLQKIWDPGAFEAPDAVPDPENPGKYIVTIGHHRIEAWRRQVGDNSNIEIIVTHADVNDPALRAAVAFKADASNRSIATLNFRENARIVANAEASGTSPEIIGETFRMTPEELQQYRDANLLGPQAIDRATDDKGLAAIVPELGRAMRLYGLSAEEANGLLNRIASGAKSSRPTVGALRETLDKFGSILRDQAATKAQGPGFPGMGDAAGEKANILQLMDEHARASTALKAEINALKRQQKANEKTLSPELAAQAGEVTQGKIDALQERLDRSEENLNRAARGMPPLEPPDVAQEPDVSATNATPTPNGGATTPADNTFPATVQPTIQPTAGGNGVPVRPRFPPTLGSSGDPVGDAIDALMDAADFKADYEKGKSMGRRAQLAARADAIREGRRQGLSESQIEANARGAMRGPLADPSFDLSHGLDMEGLLKIVHDAEGNRSVSGFTATQATSGLRKMEGQRMPANSEIEAMGAVFGARFQQAIQDINGLFDVQRKVVHVLQVGDMELELQPGDRVSLDSLAAAIMKQFPNTTPEQAQGVAGRLYASDELRAVLDWKTGKVLIHHVHSELGELDNAQSMFGEEFLPQAYADWREIQPPQPPPGAHIPMSEEERAAVMERRRNLRDARIAGLPPEEPPTPQEKPEPAPRSAEDQRFLFEEQAAAAGREKLTPEHRAVLNEAADRGLNAHQRMVLQGWAEQGWSANQIRLRMEQMLWNNDPRVNPANFPGENSQAGMQMPPEGQPSRLPVDVANQPQPPVGPRGDLSLQGQPTTPPLDEPPPVDNPLPPSGPSQPVGSADEFIRDWKRSTGEVLAGIRAPGAVGHIYDAIRATIAGDLHDSYLVGLLHRRWSLEEGLHRIDEPVLREYYLRTADSGPKTEFGEHTPLDALTQTADEKFGREAPIDDVIRAITNKASNEEIDMHYGKARAAATDAKQQIKDVQTNTYVNSQAFRAGSLFAERVKNTVYGFDLLGVAGQQGLAAIRSGGLPMLAGGVNRLLAALHSPAARDVYAGETMNRKMVAIRDGLTFGIEPSNLNVRAGSLLSYAGRLGQKLDKPLINLSDRLTTVQYSGILATLRQMQYEGNLVLLDLTGQDIRDRAVRIQAADYASAATSAAPRATAPGRAAIERLGLTSAQMTRAQANRILQAAAIIKPSSTAAQRILAASAILSEVAFTLAVGKLVNDRIGITDFQFNPTLPGFGTITLPTTDSKGKHHVVSMFPQASLDKAIFGSIAALKAEDPALLRDTWLRYASSRTSLLGGTLLASAGVGYDSNGRFHAGDLTPAQRAKAAIPLPTGVQSAVVQGQTDPLSIAFNQGGVNAYPESGAAETARAIKDEQSKGLLPTEFQNGAETSPVKSYTDLVQASPSKADEFDKRHPDLQQARISSGSSTTQAVAKLQGDLYANQIRRDQGDGTTPSLLETNPKLWRKQSGEEAGRVNAQIEQAYRDAGAYSHEPRGDLDRANNAYHQAILAATHNAQVDWDEVDQAVAKMPANQQDLLFQNRLKGETPARQQYIRDLTKLAPYFAERDREWKVFTADKPQIAKFKTFDDYRDSVIARVHDQGGIGWTEATNETDKALGTISDDLSAHAAAYLAHNARDLLPLLDKYDFYVSKLFQPALNQIKKEGAAGTQKAPGLNAPGAVSPTYAPALTAR